MGNVAEMTKYVSLYPLSCIHWYVWRLIYSHFSNFRFEKMGEQCKKSLEILKLAQNRGLEPPKHLFEERTYSTVRSDILFAYLMNTLRKAT